jgi:serine/threonine protein kinase
VNSPHDASPNGVENKQEHRLPDFSPGEVIGGKFLVTKKLGEGMLGAVYLVGSMKDKRKMALKILRPNLVAEEIDLNRFTRELNLAKQLKHPGIVNYHEIGEHEGLKFFTMDFVEGASLRDKMEEYKKAGRDFTPQEMYGFLIQILEILRYAHQTTLHRNLKPENILMVQEKGKDNKTRLRIKVTDFAIAHVVSPTIFASSFIRREEAFYLAPEISRFQDKAGPESDIYSVGAIFYEMLTGKPPIGRYLLPSEVNSHLSKKLDTLVEIALAPSPADRFQNAEDMINTVKLTFADLYGSSGGTVFRILAVLAVAALIGAGVGTYFYLDEPPTAAELAAANAEHIATILDQVNADNTPISEADLLAKEALHPDMAYIPAGYYLKGRWYFDELAGASESVEIKRYVQGYWIDKYEYPNENGAVVVNLLTWNEAANFCKKNGKTLCTEDQWEKACKGPEMLAYPYGQEFEPDTCLPTGAKLKEPYTIGSDKTCVSGYGVQGMGGGCNEWTFSKAKGDRNIVKGGYAPGQEQGGTRCAARKDEKPSFAHQNLAFRCCVNDE